MGRRGLKLETNRDYWGEWVGGPGGLEEGEEGDESGNVGDLSLRLIGDGVGGRTGLAVLRKARKAMRVVMLVI